MGAIASKRKRKRLLQTPIFEVQAIFERIFHATFLDLRYQCSMRLYFWIWSPIIRAPVFFIPDEILAPQFKQPLMDHAVVMDPNGPNVSMNIFIPYLLCRVADVLDVA